MKEAGQILAEEIKKGSSPSVQYYLFDKDNIIQKIQLGYADIDNKINVDDDTIYHAFSVTKTFTALAILQLAQQGKLDIEQPVINYLPDFPYESIITIQQVLSHTAGIANPLPLNWIHLESEHELFDRNNFFNQMFLKHKKTRREPNEKFSYSNLGYVILGRLIEKITCETYETYVTENIIGRLAIDKNDLGFEITDHNKYAKGYIKKSSITNFILGFFIDKSKYMDKAEGNWKPFKNFYVNGVSYGGLIGKPSAFVKYMQELLKPSDQVITDRYKQMLFTENLNNNKQKTGMCLSWFKGELNGNQYYTHAGGGGGYYCEIRIYPGLHIGSVIFFNRTGIKDERYLNKIDKPYLEKQKPGNPH